MEGAARLVVATGNAKKAREIARLLGDRLRVETLADHPEIEMPEETGTTFSANALLKAEFVAQALGCPALADDSGLVVDALDGRPGVHSARYAPGTDQDRFEKLLNEMIGIPSEARTARFVCAIAWVVPGRAAVVEEGRIEGAISLAASGEGGFGYDPVFLIAGTGGRTMAQLSAEEKAAISHRGQALRALFPHLARHFSLELSGQSP